MESGAESQVECDGVIGNNLFNGNRMNLELVIKFDVWSRLAVAFDWLKWWNVNDVRWNVRVKALMNLKGWWDSCALAKLRVESRDVKFRFGDFILLSLRCRRWKVCVGN